MSNALVDKAIWLADNDRVHIILDTDWYTEAVVEGINGTYQVVENPDGWACSCEAGSHHVRCSHVEAVLIVRDTYGTP